jgi:hypothetical protein
MDCQTAFAGHVMNTPLEGTGFIAPLEQTLGQERHVVAVTSLVASLVLALCTIVAATVVSVGIARASVGDGVIDNEGTLFVAALLLGLLAFLGIGSITLLPRRDTTAANKHRH